MQYLYDLFITNKCYIFAIPLVFRVLNAPKHDFRRENNNVT